MKKTEYPKIETFSQETIDLFQKCLPIIRKGFELFEQNNAKYLPGIGSKLESIKAYLIKENMVFPENAEEFFSWYLNVKHGFFTPAEFEKELPQIEYNDFTDFHKYKWYILKKGKGWAIGDMPNVKDYEIIDNKVVLLEAEQTRKGEGETQNERTLDQCFMQGKEGLKKMLDVAVKENLIKVNTDFQNGYEWVYDGKDKDDNKRTRLHGICAFWQCAKDNKLIKDNLKNNELSTKAIQTFFELVTLAKGTLDETNPRNVEFLRLKKQLDKALKTSTLE